MSTTNKSRYAGWTSTQLHGKTVWVVSFEAALHFHKKEVATKEMMALRTLELLAVKADVGSATQIALDYIKSQMVETNKKIIAANRKSDRMGWYVMTDEQMQSLKEAV